jgi:hypothetical protein
MQGIEQLQLLLLLRDSDLASLIDGLVRQRAIGIPVNEVRRPMRVAPQLLQRDRKAELSSLGVRAATKRPLLHLVASIWDEHEDRGMLEELGWRLQMRAGKAHRADLMGYIRTKGPATAVNELILSSMPVAFGIAEKLNLSLANGPTGDHLAELFLWKFGFNPSHYADEYLRFRTRLQQFTDTLLRVSSIRSEDDRETIRSIGVNVFVSVEHILEEFLAYNVWLLVTDHFLDSRFEYDPLVAVRSVPLALGAQLVNGDFSCSWNLNGGNTLGTSMAYLEKAASWMQELVSRDRAAVARPRDEFPHFAEDRERIFPFRHKELWADAESAQLSDFARGFSDVVAQLSRSDLASIRNGLDHKRDEGRFPAIESMLACVTRLKDAFDLADEGRYLPKTFWLYQRQEDRFGRQEYALQDYMNRHLVLRGPSVVAGMDQIEFDRPVLIAAGNLLGQPNSELRFSLKASTPFSRYWDGYPRRRVLTARQSQDDHTSAVEGEALTE